MYSNNNTDIISSREPANGINLHCLWSCLAISKLDCEKMLENVTFDFNKIQRIQAVL